MLNFVPQLIFKLELVAHRLPVAILTFLAGAIAVSILQGFFALALKTARVNKPTQEILQPTVGLVLWIGVIALVCQSLGLNQIAIALSGSIAVIGFGIATGANKLVSDILAGLFLARNRDFKIGQVIKIGDAVGQIHSLDSRKVRLLGSDGTLHIIPNTKFDEQPWEIVPSKKT